jgi:hypothetical protein
MFGLVIQNTELTKDPQTPEYVQIQCSSEILETEIKFF